MKSSSEHELLSQGIDVDRILRRKETVGREAVISKTVNDSIRTGWAGEVGPHLIRLTSENGLRCDSTKREVVLSVQAGTIHNLTFIYVLPTILSTSR